MHQIIWEDAPRRRGDEHVTTSRNRKLIRVTSSNKPPEHKCVDLSDYNRYVNQIWYTAQAQQRHLGFRKMSVTPNWIELFAPDLVGRCMAMRR